VLPPALASRAHAWHNELNVKEGWICWDNIYFEAPGALGGHLTRQQVGCGALSLLSIYSISLFLQKAAQVMNQGGVVCSVSVAFGSAACLLLQVLSKVCVLPAV
jgi:hypothetical protein